MRVFLMVLFFATSLQAQSVQERIMAIHSHQDLATFIEEQRGQIDDALYVARQNRTLAEGLEQESGLLWVNGSYYPDWLWAAELVPLALRHTRDFIIHDAELLEMGFPSEDLEDLKAAQRLEQREIFQKHFTKALSYEFQKRSIQKVPLYQAEWPEFFASTVGNERLHQQGWVNGFLEAKSLAGVEAKRLMTLELLSKLEPESLRFLLNYAYDVLAKQTDVPYRSITHFSNDEVASFVEAYSLEIQPKSSIKEQIMAIKSHDDLDGFLHFTDTQISNNVERLRTYEFLPEGIDRKRSNRISIDGVHYPEFINVESAFRSALTLVKNSDNTISELLKRGFPESDVDVLKKLSVANSKDQFQKLYVAAFEEKLRNAAIESSKPIDMTWEQYFATKEGNAFILTDDHARHFLQARNDARLEVKQRLLIDSLSLLNVQSVRVLLRFAYEVSVSNLTVVYARDAVSDKSVSFFLESIRSQ